MALQETQIAPGADPGPPGTRWRPGLDGIRAVAVLGVMAYHEPNIELAGGFLGVDLFFVLSGFLITGLLLDERLRTGSVSLRDFWNRRARRLLPALAVLLLAVVVATTFIGDVAQRRDLPGGVLSAILYVSNWNLIAHQQSYFDQFQSLSPLQHLWSLAIEEQFYVVWPLVAIACLARSRRLLIVVSALATVASVVLMAHFLGDGDPSRSYYGTDTRAFALLIGALGAMFLWHVRPAGRRAQLAGILGLVGLALAYALVADHDRWMYRGGFVAFALLALAVIVLASGDTIVSRIMGHPILRKIGFLSYALYLWHWPIRVLITDSRLGLPDSGAGEVAGVLIRLGLTFGAAWLSMATVERWFRRSRLGIVRFLGAWLVIGALLLGLAFWFRPSAGSTIDTSIGSDQAQQRDRNLSVPLDPEQPSLLVVGDSIAITLEFGIRRVIDPTVSVIGGAELGCALLTSPRTQGFDGRWVATGSNCPDHDDYWSRLIEARDPDVAIMLLGAWDLYTRDWGNGPVGPGDPEFDKRYRRALDTSLDVLASRGAQVVLLTTPCFAPPPGERVGPQYDLARVERLAEMQREAIADLERRRPDAAATIADLQTITCDDGFTWTRDGVQWRPDGSHFSIDGSQVAATWLLGELPEAVRSRLGLARG